LKIRKDSTKKALTKNSYTDDKDGRRKIKEETKYKEG
jgi:hypothetical protein